MALTQSETLWIKQFSNEHKGSLLNMNDLILRLFSNEDHQTHFMSFKNHNGKLNGQTPMQYLISSENDEGESVSKASRFQYLYDSLMAMLWS